MHRLSTTDQISQLAYTLRASPFNALHSGISVINFSHALVAQWIEQWLPKPCVGGSSPSEGAKLLTTSDRLT